MLGVHINGGSAISDSLKEVISLKMGCAQVFIESPQRWSTGKLGFDSAYIKELSQMIQIIVHAPFIINPAAVAIGRFRQSCGMMTRLMIVADSIGAKYVVIHPGSGSLTRVVELCKYIVSKKFKSKLCLENDSGSKKGTRVGSIINVVKVRKEIPEIGVAIDTAHAYANGFGIETDKVIQLIKKLNPDIIHLNEPDSNVIKGGHLDRHNSLITVNGKIGLSSLLKLYLNHRDIPCIIEAKKEIALVNYKLLKQEIEQIDES